MKNVLIALFSMLITAVILDAPMSMWPLYFIISFFIAEILDRILQGKDGRR